ncbi:MAG TPA: cell division ATP-binding protein FtsE [Firmicutes bacterium]|nr:cell division ATP-binding protein FtsE [Bacillota bacterium]
MGPLIRFVDVTKVYENNCTALRGINLSIEKGEFVFITGASGAGKSTLLKMIYGEEFPTSGRVIVDSWDVSKIPRKKLPYLRRSIGVVFQDFKLLPDRTVFENVAFALRVTDASRLAIRRRVPAVLELCGIKDKSNCRPDELSGGEQQRVSLARALVNNPILLVADEPTGNLDPDTARGIFALLEDVNDMGTTVIVATHAQAMVDHMRKRVVTLRDGILQGDEARGIYRA